jgi:hypothetical protein
MAYYLIEAHPKTDLDELKRRLQSGEIEAMSPFGTAMDYALRRARLTPEGAITWVEEDYCTPTLRMERAAVFDDYFTGLQVERVQENEGWQRIADLPHLWEGLRE